MLSTSIFVESLVDLFSDDAQRNEHNNVPWNNSASISLEPLVKSKWPFFESFDNTV